jgi:Ca-activated chloride channel family protein
MIANSSRIRSMATLMALAAALSVAAPGLPAGPAEPDSETESRIDFEERVALVNVYATVRDRSGGFVSDLTRSDFRIREDGVSQVITHFAVENMALNVVLVVDTSNSMADRNKIDTARKAAERFLETMQFPRDRAMIIAISSRPEPAQEWTSDLGELTASLRGLEAHGTTALYDSILLGVEELRGLDGRRVIILLSDGMDRPGSVITFEHALDSAKRAGVMVYSIGLGNRLWGKYDLLGRHTAEDILRTLAGETGGAAFFATRPRHLKRAYRQVAEELEHQYGLAYVSLNETRDGAWRRIDVSVPRDRGTVFHRPGYYAPD